MEKDITSINENFSVQIWEWRIKRISWIFMALFLGYGLAGGFGDSGGLLSIQTSITTFGTIKYEGLMRVEKQSEIKVYLNSKDTSITTIAINDDYLDKVQIIQIIPEPELSEIKNQKIVYHFSSESKGVITFILDPQRSGDQTLNIGLNGENVKLNQYIFF